MGAIFHPLNFFCKACTDVMAWGYYSFDCLTRSCIAMYAFFVYIGFYKIVRKIIRKVTGSEKINEKNDLKETGKKNN